MSADESPSLQDNVRRVVDGSSLNGVPDAELLARFAKKRDEAAFELLLWRHGGLVLNVSQQESVDVALKDIEGKEGPVTVLVNNAGITRDNLLLRMKAEEWDEIMNTNLASVFRLSKAVLRGMMKARRGRIINIASVVGVMGNAGQTNYAAAKAGIIGFSKSLAREVGSRNITVNVVAPGFIETEMTEAMGPAVLDEVKKRVPAKRLGQVGDVAAAVLFLASDAAAYITGQVLTVDGGLSA